MRRTTLLLLLALGACAPRPPLSPPPPTPDIQPIPPAPAVDSVPPMPEAAPPPPDSAATIVAVPSATAATEQGIFVLQQGGNPVLTERFTRTPAQLEAEFSAPGQGRVAYSLTLAPDATVSAMRGRAYTAEDTVAAQSFTAEFQGDSVFSRTLEGDSTRTAAVATRPGAIPYINPSPSLMEQILRRARVLGGDSVQVPALVIGGGARTTLPATVVFTPPDSARISLGPAEVRVRTDAEGHLLGGVVPAQGVTIEREGGVR